MDIIKIKLDDIKPHIRYVNNYEPVCSYKEKERIIYDHELMYVTEGETDICYDGVDHHLKKGHVFYFRPFVRNYMTVDVNNKFNKALQCVLLVIVPLTLFFSLMSDEIWTLFYGNSYYGPIVYRAFVFTALFGGFYTIIVNTLQGVNKYKLVIFTVLLGLGINAVLDVPFMLLADKLGLNASYGAVIAAICGYTISTFISLYVLRKKYGFNYRSTFRVLPKYVVSWICFVLVIVLLKAIIPDGLDGRFIQVPILAVFGLISFAVYGLLCYKNGNLRRVFGNKFDKMIGKFVKI